jgi:hypothetical protein
MIIKRKKRIDVRLDIEQIEQLKQVGKIAEMSFSAAIRVILTDYLKYYNYSKTQ